MSANYSSWLARKQEQNEYYNMNLLPCIKQFLRGEQNEKRWTYCDMLFTIFLHATLDIMYDKDGHDLYMEHMQAWFRALSRDEDQADFRQWSCGLDVPPRVRNCEKSLIELENLRHRLNLPPFRFDIEVFEQAKTCDKKYKRFCLCLTYIVKFENPLLRNLSAEWDADVVRCWFDEDNTENAGAFISRAETFFEKHGNAALQHYVQASFATSANPYTIA